ncbi:MAG: hypothetical protein QM774_10380 [Gordonia sp. (in: high G+C Gram-positive bacteria)]|uniref:hypothetical protein n=1 Tax=Gordonia sp. (in: high G+C Gram-positive bacteria) TaxID=84139 RepID=UPI0039E6BF7C
MSRSLTAIAATSLMLLLPTGTGIALAAPGDPEPTTSAQPADPANPDDSPAQDGALRVGMDLLGSSNTIMMPGQGYDFVLNIAVPDGTTPATVTGRVTVPAYVTGGTIDVRQGDRVLSRTAVPTAPNAPISLPLTGIKVDETTRSASVTLHSYLRTDGFCDWEPDDSFRITDAGVTFSGTPATPTTVADFLPPVTTGVTLYVPQDVRKDEGAAAVGLATAIVAHYTGAPIRVQTKSLPRSAMRPPATADPLDRQIVVSEDEQGGLALADDGRYLTVGGKDLGQEAAFLTSDLSQLAMGSAALPGPSVPSPQLPREVQTLADIGVGDQHVTALGWPSLAVGIDQARLGRPVQNVRVQIQGTYTPPPTATGGQVVVRSGDRVIDTWAADASGAFNRWVTVPNDVLHRYTELRVTVERGDTRGGCGDETRASLSLSSAGQIQVDPASPPVPAGLESVPQSLMPRTQLAWTKGDVADVTRAVTVMTGMQRLSAVPLGVDVVDMNALNASQPEVLISGDGTGLPNLTLPVRGDGDGRIEVTGLDGQPAVTNIPHVPFGSLQAYWDGKRSVLAATSTDAPNLLDDALDWLNADPTRWSSLSGTALLQAADHAPVFYGRSTAAAPAASGMSTLAKAGIGVAVVVAALAAVAGLLLWRRRRPAPAVTAAADTDADGTGDADQN